MIVLKLLKALHNQHDTKNFQPQTSANNIARSLKKKTKHSSELTLDPQWIRVPNTTCDMRMDTKHYPKGWTSEHQIREVCHTWLNPPAVVNIPPGLSGECPKHHHRNGAFLNNSSSYEWGCPEIMGPHTNHRRVARSRSDFTSPTIS